MFIATKLPGPWFSSSDDTVRAQLTCVSYMISIFQSFIPYADGYTDATLTWTGRLSPPTVPSNVVLKLPHAEEPVAVTLVQTAEQISGFASIYDGASGDVGADRRAN